MTGASRDEALARSRRALAEMRVDGMATVLPFHRAVVADTDFTAPDDNFKVHTRWIETEFNNQIEPYSGAADLDDESAERQVIVAEVNGRRVSISLPASLVGSGSAVAAGPVKSKRSAGRSRAAASGDAVVAPMQGTIVKIAVTEGQEVATGDLICVLEAMKMENPVTAHKDGVVTGLTAEVGASLASGTVIAELK